MSSMRRKIWNLIRGGSFHGYLRTVSGYPLTLTGCMPEYPVMLSVSGNTVQNGTPAPDNPVEVQGVGDPTEDRYKLPVTVSGRNLLNIADRTTIEPEYAVPAVKRYFNNNVIVGIALNGYTNCGLCDKISVTTDYITLTSRSGYGIGFDFDVVEGEKYTIKVNTDAPSNAIASFSFYNSEGVYVSNTGTGTGTFKTITIPSGVVKMILILRANNHGTTITVSDIMLVKSAHSADTMPAYEPYHTPQTIPIYMDSPLYSNDNVADTVKLDVGNKKAICTNRISVDDNGNVTQLATPVITDISDMQDWDSIPKLWRGTAILTANTTIQPSGLTVKYYADKPEEEVS